MIDESDGDFVLLSSSGVGGFVGLALFTLAIVLYCVAYGNEKDCTASACPPGEAAHLLDHECVCTHATMPRGAP